jgi:acetoin utilization deacetylase AcuC-like enzyme
VTIGGRPRLLLLTDEAMDRHAMPGHPERPERRLAAIAGVEDAARERGLQVDRPVVDEADREDLVRVHDASYLDALDAWEAAGGGYLDPDTYLVAGSPRAARLAAGAAVAGVAAVLRGDATVVVAVVRPPGHHAAADRGKGFCLLNSVAVAAAWLRAVGGLARVGIVDWDVHHGDGTAALFADDPAVGYASTHSWGLYPGTGSAKDVGTGAGRGTTWNRPLAPGSGDVEFVAAWRDDLLPTLAAFQPDAILISAGFDAAAADPLADLEVSAAGFGVVARGVGELASELGITGVTVVLEGGYDLGALREGMAATIVGLFDGLAG